MKKKYKDKLIELAEEIKDIKEDKNGWRMDKWHVLQSKCDYLIGYILALKEI
jgi:hypothetical protein